MKREKNYDHYAPVWSPDQRGIEVTAVSLFVFILTEFTRRFRFYINPFERGRRSGDQAAAELAGGSWWQNHTLPGRALFIAGPFLASATMNR